MARVALALALLATCGCGGAASAADEGCTAASQSVCHPRLTFGDGPLVHALGSRYGPILVTDEGYVVYRFTADAPGRSRCTGPCTDRWPPLIVPPGTRVGGAELGTFSRPDGRRQLAYRGIPLYVFSNDERDVAYGEDVNDAGGWWFVVLTGQGGPADPAPPVAG